jgi:quercetin dioxygenase-like cupin family protein
MSGVGYRMVDPNGLEWFTRPHEPGEPARHVAELSEVAGFAHTRANVWRYEPGAHGKRHRHPAQEETFVVLQGTLTMYIGEPPVKVEAHAGEVIHVDAQTALQSANHGDVDLITYVYGYPPENVNGEILPSAV